MRLLPINLLFFLIGCTSYPKKMGYTEIPIRDKSILNPYFYDTNQDYIYKANVDAFSNYFGGILVIKKIDDVEHRVVFTTEMGNTIFDFSFRDDNFKVNRIIDQLDKRILIHVLQNDFKALIEEKLTAQKVYNNSDLQIAKVEIDKKPYFYTFENSHLKTITHVRNQKGKVVFEFSEINDNIAKQITITHKSIPLKIKLKAF